MSTCGMMISRQIYDKLGGWPKELGIYGGGENFINFTLGTFDMKKWIYPTEPLFHHGDSRDYYWNYDDHVKNKMIAIYLYGGQELVRRFSQNTKGRPEVLSKFCEDVIAKCEKHRKHIKQNQVMTINQWYNKNWKGEVGK
jgi:hypothetical protein